MGYIPKHLSTYIRAYLKKYIVFKNKHSNTPSHYSALILIPVKYFHIALDFDNNKTFNYDSLYNNIFFYFYKL